MGKRIQPIDLINEAKAVGWIFRAGRFPGEYQLDASIDDVPTPDYMKGSSAWPFDTYLALRQVTFLVRDGKIAAAWTREGVPWVRVKESRVSATKALAYIKAHPRESAGAVTTGAPDEH